MRLVMTGIVDYLMNNSAIRKRKKGMTFKEWFCYSRFRTEIPKYHIVFYYSVIVSYLVLFVIIFWLHLASIIFDFSKIRIIIVLCTIFFAFLYSAIFGGIHWTWTRINRKENVTLEVSIKRHIEKKCETSIKRKIKKTIK